MDEQTRHTPLQEDLPKTQAFTFDITGEDEEAQRALSEKKPKKKATLLPWILGAAVVVVAALLVLKPGTKTEKTPAGDEPTLSDTVDADEAKDEPGEADQSDEAESSGTQDDSTANDAESTSTPAVSYTIAADDMTEEIMNAQVAACAGDRLTNRELPYYYWQQYYSFMNSYGSYAAYFIDSSTPFDEQTCIFDETLTWQQYFLESAIYNYLNVTAVWQDARLAGFQLGQEDADYLDGLGNEITVAAATYGFESAEAYLQTAYGPSATLSGYRDYVERQMLASAYLQSLVDATPYTEDEISAYYDENAETYTANAIEKTDVNMVNVRHVLIMPEETDESGNYTDAAWQTAEATAQALYDEWQAGERTEDSFAMLAMENSVDGSASDGGLIENIYPGRTVEAFDAWCFDAARQPGDTGLVRTEYGYHIIYFSSTCEHPYWYLCAEEDYLSQLSRQLLLSATEKYETEQSEDQAAIVDIMQN